MITEQERNSIARLMADLDGRVKVEKEREKVWRELYYGKCRAARYHALKWSTGVGVVMYFIGVMTGNFL